ncbi:MAG TPA: RNA 2',3'-cyclic phosphodiesterase [Rudaea sp.]|nr:RNA 2',3'-cyclic phosphodiesterase [Rudaea sp.]
MRISAHRLFFALRADAHTTRAIASAMATLETKTAIRHRPIDPANLHVTLHFLGTFAQFPVDIAARAKAAVAAQVHSSFDFVLDQIASFRGQRQSPWVLRCAPDAEAGLCEFQGWLGDALVRGGVTVDDREFVPHATIAYGDSELPAPVAITPVRWPARSFALVDSHIGHAHHEVLAEWKLR